MTLPRKQLISIENTAYYHIITRCVRRAFLCGKDKYSGNCYEHRRKLIVDRIKKLAEVFNIDICAYAIMSNHYHLVLKVPLCQDSCRLNKFTKRGELGANNATLFTRTKSGSIEEITAPRKSSGRRDIKRRRHQ